MQAGVGTTTTVIIGGDVATEAVIALDGVTIKDANSQNLDYYATNISTGSHSLVFSCPGVQSFCFANVSFSAGTGFSVSPNAFNLSSTQLVANGTVSETFTVTKP